MLCVYEGICLSLMATALADLSFQLLAGGSIAWLTEHSFATSRCGAMKSCVSVHPCARELVWV